MARTDAIQEKIDRHIGRQIKRRRNLLGYTQETLGGLTGTGFQQIQKYESGARVTGSKLYKLAQALHVPINFFFNGLPPPEVSGDVLPLDIDDALKKKETFELVRVYYSLSDVSRRKLLALAMSLQTETDDSTPEK